MFHLNIRSINKNIDNLNYLLANPENNPDIILISETWLSPSAKLSKLSNIKINNYTFISQPRSWSRGGGVGMFIRSSLSYTIFTNFNNLHPHFEQLTIKLKSSSLAANTNCIIAVLYRPPNFDSELWNSNFEKYYTTLLSNNCDNIILTGDLNYNLLDNSNPNTKNFNNIMNIFDLTQCITSPTRVSNNSASLLDVFLTNKPELIIKSGILHDKPIADHETIYLDFHLKPKKIKCITKTYRNLKKLNPSFFLKDLLAQDFSSIYLNCNPNTMLHNLNTIFKNIIDRHAPLKTIKTNKALTPWITAHHIKLIRKHNYLYRQLKND